MLIDLRDIEEGSLEFVDEFEIAPERLDPDMAADPVLVRLQGNVAPMGNGFVVAGTLRAEGKLFCSRCLVPVVWTGEEGFSVELRYPGDVAEDEMELSGEDMNVVFLESDQLDLAELAAEQVILSLPMRVLCQDDCAGLCPTCGANRNLKSECGCEPEIDPRWHALRALQEKPS